MKKMVLLSVFMVHGVCFLSAHTGTKTTLLQLSRSCIKVWSLMRDLVDNRDLHNNELLAGDDPEHVDRLDNLLCKMVHVRDMIKSLDFSSSADANSVAHYIDSSLDCIGQYTYDLVKQYPGNWSSVIQEQVFRAQDAYAQSMMEQATN